MAFFSITPGWAPMIRFCVFDTGEGHLAQKRPEEPEVTLKLSKVNDVPVLLRYGTYARQISKGLFMLHVVQ